MRHRPATASARQATGQSGLVSHCDVCSAPAEAPTKSDVDGGIGYEWNRRGDGQIATRLAEPRLIDTLALAEVAARKEPRAFVRTLTLILSVMTVLLAIRYIAWRFEINDWRIWWLSLPLLVAEVFTAFHILGYQYTIWPRKSLAIDISTDVSNFPIFVFIPTVNEGLEILEPTVRGAIGARDSYLEAFPDATIRIIICNDGFVAKSDDWKTPVELASRLGVECLTRQIGGGAKAGNIEHAREQVGATGDSLIVVLDADQVAEPEFLLRTTPQFGDPAIGWVQTRQYYRNQDSRVSRWAEHQASLFYDQVCPGKATMNASYICGTNVVIRAKVLDEIGGFPQESITEDFAASIRTHQSWRSVYIKDVLAQGLGPMDLTSYYVQQSRWARGTLGVLFSDWKRLLLPSRPGMSFGQRLQYLLSGTHYLCGLRDAIFISCAVTCLFLMRSPIKPVTLDVIAFYLLPYIVASQMLILLQVRSTSIFSATVIGYGSFPTLVLSLFEALTNRRVHFKVTPKSSTQGSDLPSVVPHIIIGAICIGAIVHAFATHTAWTTTNAIPLFWVFYALVMLAPTFLLAHRKSDRATD